MRRYRFRMHTAVDRAAESRVGWLIMLLAPLVTAGSGLLNLVSLLGDAGAVQRSTWLHRVFPVDFSDSVRSVTLLLGFALVLCSVHLRAGKRRALQLALALSLASAVLEALRRSPWQAAFCALLAAALWLVRSRFRVRSEAPSLKTAVVRGAIATAVPFLYGLAGFWLLEPKHFGMNFHWWDAAARTIRFLTFFGDPTLLPHTRYAGWFLSSITLITTASLLYVGFVLFRPVIYRFHVEPAAQKHAAEIAQKHGRSGQDFFKHFPDKSYFFTRDGRSFIAYRVSRSFAIALGDPVGPADGHAAAVDEFLEFCRECGWSVGFHQVYPDFLPIYAGRGFRRLKVGEEAIANLASFSLDGSARKELRNSVNRLTRLGYRVERVESPLTPEMEQRLKRVSDEWLALPDHRERRFTLGRFDSAYLRSTTVYLAISPHGEIAAFVNLIPSYSPGLATVDLMRRAADAPNGVMDFLFSGVLLDLKARGYKRFSLGMTPRPQSAEGQVSTVEERVLYWAMRHAPALFRTGTLRKFKAKYADQWEPRYTVYRNPLDLPKFGLALRSVTEIPRRPREAV